MTKLKLADAVEAFKKGVDKRNVRNAESEIAAFIDEQIELKEAEIKAFQKDIQKYGEQNERDFKDSLVMFDESRITSVKGRESYAKEYVLDALAYMQRNKNFIADKEDQIKTKKDQILKLQELRGILETITVEVESEE